MQLGGLLKSAKSKNVTNGSKASEKVRKGCKSEMDVEFVEWYKTLQMVVKCHLLSSFVVFEHESSQIVTKVLHMVGYAYM